MVATSPHKKKKKTSFWESEERVDIEQASSINLTLSNVGNIFEPQCGHFEILKMTKFFWADSDHLRKILSSWPSSLKDSMSS